VTRPIAFLRIAGGGDDEGLNFPRDWAHPKHWPIAAVARSVALPKSEALRVLIA